MKPGIIIDDPRIQGIKLYIYRSGLWSLDYPSGMYFVGYSLKRLSQNLEMYKSTSAMTPQVPYHGN